jgi:signal transduction histidine kinase
MKRLFGQRPADLEEDVAQLELEAERGRRLVEESRELVVVLDDEGHVVASSRRAREALGRLEAARPLAADLVEGRTSFTVDYEIEGRRETLLYLRDPGDLAAYEELRAGFTAAVSHELRTPLARLLALLESISLPGSDPDALVEQALAELTQIRELIDDVLFLSELESGRELVGLGSTRALPVLREAVERLEEQAGWSGVRLTAEGDEDAELPLRPRMLAVVAENLASNAIRYAGPGATCRLSVHREDDTVVLAAADDGVGVTDQDLPRLFERFYRADRARASRGTGLGLAIVKHVVTSAGGRVDAFGARGEGLTVRCVFPVA